MNNWHSKTELDTILEIYKEKILLIGKDAPPKKYRKKLVLAKNATKKLMSELIGQKEGDGKEEFSSFINGSNTRRARFLEKVEKL